MRKGPMIKKIRGPRKAVRFSSYVLLKRRGTGHLAASSSLAFWGPLLANMSVVRSTALKSFSLPGRQWGWPSGPEISVGAHVER